MVGDPWPLCLGWTSNDGWHPVQVEIGREMMPYGNAFNSQKGLVFTETVLHHQPQWVCLTSIRTVFYPPATPLVEARR